MYGHTSFQTLVRTGFLGVGLLVVLFYVLFQARFLITGPQIIVTSDNTTMKNDRAIQLTGTAYNISRFWLNGRPIFTDAQGNFNEALILENGYTIATLRAEDRYGRATEVTHSYVYRPASFIQ